MADRIEDIKDAPTRAKLEGVQEVVYSIDSELTRLNAVRRDRIALTNAASHLVQKMEKEYARINSDLDRELFSPDVARAMIEQTKRMVGIAIEVRDESKTEAAIVEGKILGLEAAVGISKQKFEETATKYERHLRMEEEDPLGRKAAAAPNKAGAPRSKKTKRGQRSK